MNDEVKQRAMLAVLSFNITLIVVVMGLYLFRGTPSWSAFFVQFAIGAAVGLIVGAGAFFVAGMSQK